MQAEIISIGDELTSGQRLDTNSQWLSQRLGELGVRVLYHTTVADDMQANLQVFRQAVQRADLIVATGGLGPTADDLTRDVLAQLAGVELVLDESSLAHIKNLFEQRAYREMPERNVVQAMFPAGSRPIPNPNGTAPGIALEIQRNGRGPAHLFALPGVPAEMIEMFGESVRPGLLALGAGQTAIRHRVIKCFGVGESHLEQMLPDLIRRGRDPAVGITVSAATICLRVTAEGASDAACQAAMEPTLATIRECLGELVFGEEEDELEHAVLRLLTQTDRTLAVAEWGTGGLISHWLGELSDPTGRFAGGVVVPGPRAAKEWFGVDPGRFTNGSVAQERAVAAMASACRERLHVDLALAVGPFPTTAFDPAKPGRWTCGLATADETTTESFAYTGHPAILKLRAAKQALNAVRLALLRGAERGRHDADPQAPNRQSDR